MSQYLHYKSGPSGTCLSVIIRKKVLPGMGGNRFLSFYRVLVKWVVKPGPGILKLKTGFSDITSIIHVHFKEVGTSGFKYCQLSKTILIFYINADICVHSFLF